MNTLPRFLWKEWRDHRAIVLGFLAAIPVVVALAAWALPSGFVRDEWFVWAATLGCFGVATLSLVTDVVPGEERRGRLGFLRRLPHGIGVAFLAKALFATLVLAGAAAYGYVVAGLIGNAGFPVPGAPWRMFALAPVCVAAWAFVASCWLPRGALALPATALVLGGLGLPLFLAYYLNPGLTPRPEDVVTVQWILALGALPVAWLSFARGRRFERGVWSAAWRGLLASLLVFSPAWALAARDVVDWRTLDVASPRLRIVNGVLSPDGKTAYLNVHVRLPRRDSGPNHALVVDLGTGGHTRLGNLHDGFDVPQWASAVVTLSDIAASKKADAWLHYYDADTRERIKSGWASMRLPEVEARRGGPALPDGFRRIARFGLGWWGHEPKHGVAIYDPFRKKLYPYFRRPYYSAHVRPGRWLVKSRKDSKEYRFRAQVPYRFLDPDTGEMSPPLDFTRFGAVLDDGRLFQCEADRVVVFDPETGVRVETGIQAEAIDSLHRTPEGQYVLAVYGDHHWRFVRFDPATNRSAAVAVGRFRVVGIPDEASLVGIRDERELVRVHFDGPAPEVLFPR